MFRIYSAVSIASSDPLPLYTGLVSAVPSDADYYGGGYVGGEGYGSGFNGYGGLGGFAGPAFGLSGSQSNSYRTGYSSDGSYTAPGTSLAPPDSTVGSFSVGSSDAVSLAGIP